MCFVGWLNSKEIPPPPVILFSYWDFFQNPRSDLVRFRDGSVCFVFSCIRDFCVGRAQGSARKREVRWTGIPVISRQSESREGSVAWSESATADLALPGVNLTLWCMGWFSEWTLKFAYEDMKFFGLFSNGPLKASPLPQQPQVLHDIHWAVKGSIFLNK